MLYRHGDVLIQKTKSIPKDTRLQRHVILAHGEITGHSHRIEDPKTAEIYAHKYLSELYLRVTSPRAYVVHEEHDRIELKKGIYRVWRQREYTPRRIVTVRD